MTSVRIIVGAVLACGVLALFASSAAADRSCGTFRDKGSAFSVTVRRGAVSCRRATHVLSAFFHHKGKLYGPPNGPTLAQWWSVDGWRCAYGAGAGGCIRGSKSSKTARDWIEANVV